MTLAEPFPLDTLVILPWPDPVVEAFGHDPRSPYVERFWLGLLGPSTTWLVRHLAAGLDAYPDGFELSLPETASALGLVNQTGRSSPFVRALRRVVQFGLAQPHSSGLAVRRKLPPLTVKQVARLSPAQQAAHRRWCEWEHDEGDTERERTRARALALSMLETGDDPALVGAQLAVLGVAPRAGLDAVAWAMACTYAPTPADAA